MVSLHHVCEEFELIRKGPLKLWVVAHAEAGSEPLAQRGRTQTTAYLTRSEPPALADAHPRPHRGVLKGITDIAKKNINFADAEVEGFQLLKLVSDHYLNLSLHDHMWLSKGQAQGTQM